MLFQSRSPSSIPTSLAAAILRNRSAARAIALKLAQALLERHDAERTRDKLLPSFLKMAAIATIADAVPLRGENRVIAALGLRELRRPVGTGLRALLAAAQLDPATKAITGFDIAFRLAPRINAAGRMDVASEVIELFCTRDAARANELADKLERLNRERRDTEARALAAIETASPTMPNLPTRDSWSSTAKDGIAASSASWLRAWWSAPPNPPSSSALKMAWRTARADRSMDFQLLEAIETCADLFTRFGGHAFAVGFALPAASLPELKRRLAACAAERLAAREPERLFQIHAELPLHRITARACRLAAQAGAAGSRQSRAYLHCPQRPPALAPRIMKERHLRLELAQDEASGSQSAPWAGKWLHAPRNSTWQGGANRCRLSHSRESTSRLWRHRTRDRRHAESTRLSRPKRTEPTASRGLSDCCSTQSGSDYLWSFGCFSSC